MSLSVLWLAYLGALSHKSHISKPGPKGLEFYFYFHTHGFLQATQVLQRTPSIVWTFSWIIFSFTCLDTCSYMVILWKKLSICMLSYINLSVGEGHRDQLRLGKAVPQPEPVRWATPQVWSGHLEMRASWEAPSLECLKWDTDHRIQLWLQRMMASRYSNFLTILKADDNF